MVIWLRLAQAAEPFFIEMGFELVLGSRPTQNRAQWYKKEPVSKRKLTAQTIQRYYRVERKQIAFLRFIIEAYDGIAVMRTVDAQKGIVALSIAPDCIGEVESLIADLQNQMRIVPHTETPAPVEGK